MDTSWVCLATAYPTPSHSIRSHTIDPKIDVVKGGYIRSILWGVSSKSLAVYRDNAEQSHRDRDDDTPLSLSPVSFTSILPISFLTIPL